MPVASVATFAETLRQHHLLEPGQLAQLEQELSGRSPEPRDLARELLRRGWLTAYQVNQVFLDRAEQLLLGSYVLLERLGEGGMGEVFKARNWKLGHLVALKVIRKDRIDTSEAGAVRRFLREIRLAAQLAHPNVVRAHDADEIDGTLF